jgi:hypothetical protein
VYIANLQRYFIKCTVNNERTGMCRNIKPLFNFESPATELEIREAGIQFVRKVSGFSKPSKANQEAFNLAVDEIASATQKLLDSLVTRAPRRYS